MANNLFVSVSQTLLERLSAAGARLIGEEAATLLEVSPENLTDVMQLLRQEEEISFEYLADVTAVDRKEKGLEVVYQLFSLKNGGKGTVKTMVSREKPEVTSVTGIWPGADWMEREVFDLMGVEFTGHPCLKRILLTDDFVGHPLRKDFSLQPPTQEVK